MKQNNIDQFWQNVTHAKFSFHGNQLSYAFIIPENAKAAITIVNGRCESYLKYQEVAYDFYRQGFAIFMFDHLGQGLSSRLLPVADKGYIHHFNDYIEGLALFVNQVVKANWQGTHFLLAHSMGAAISYLYLANHPHPFKKAALSAPMFGIPTQGLPYSIAKFLVKLLNAIGFNTRYFFGQAGYQEKPFLNNQLMKSEPRYAAFRRLYKENPGLKLGGVTVGWLAQAFSAIDQISKTPAALPILLLQAEKDSIVENSAQDEVVHNNSLILKKVYSNSWHEILFEQDHIRSLALNDICDFFKTDLCE
ncbi:alpha/beta fold hydrolase [Pseudoalteromonas sp. SSM20]|uniref:alpha/beta fold hydrolase n=1 Tax=Pseudoalteromonas sp. SSM20 TaxID=3139394 RepID=UPI003BABE84C